MIRPERSQIARSKPRLLGDPGEHSRPDFLTVMEREDEVRPLIPAKRSV